MFKLLMVALGALFIAGFLKYTVLIHQAWAEEEGERLGLDAVSRGVGTLLRGRYQQVPLWLALSGRRVTEGEAKMRPGLDRASVQEFVDAKALFGSVHFKRDAVWADFPRSRPDDDPEPYAAALVTAARFASTRSLEQIYRIEERLEAGISPVDAEPSAAEAVPDRGEVDG